MLQVFFANFSFFSHNIHFFFLEYDLILICGVPGDG